MMRPENEVHLDSGIDEMKAGTLRRTLAGSGLFNRPRVRPLIRAGKMALLRSKGNASLLRLQWGCL
jgi:hypothetical protein